jgi:hypothetical protein
MSNSSVAKYGRKWAAPAEFEYYTSGHNDAQVARMLRLCKRHVRRFRNGEVPIPWWTVHVLRLRMLEGAKVYREITGNHGKPVLVAVRKPKSTDPHPAVVEVEPFAKVA